MADVVSILALNMIEDLGPSRLKLLLERFGSPEKILGAKRRELISIPTIGNLLSERIVRARESIELDKELDLIKRNRIKIVTIFDEAYPRKLKEIFDPPILLYVKDKFLPEDFASVAIVGSRRASSYGLQISERIAHDLGQRGITIVSGLARGVDTAAHTGALKAGARTIAVLGNGLGVMYPPENAKLASQIANSGCLISEFPMKRAPYRGNFPRRNRVISGLSLGTLVVEAGQRSGALITAGFALDEGREVFAVPGRTDVATSKGTHGLIKDGAKLVEGFEDILEELRTPLKNYLKDAGQEAKKDDFLQPKLDGEERLIYAFLSSEPKHIDEVIDSANLHVGQVSNMLLKLEMKKLIKELPGKMFVKSQAWQSR